MSNAPDWLVALAKDLPPMLKPDELATLIRRDPQKLAQWRLAKTHGPTFVRAGRSILYPKSAVVSWMAENAVTTG